MHPCVGCKQNYKATCCEDKDGAGYWLPMTYSEALRIIRHCKADINLLDFREYNKRELRDVEESLYGTWAIQHFVDRLALFISRGLKCQFLADDGCTLGELRPHFCKLYPFQRQEDGVWRVISDEPGYCWAIDQSDSHTSVALKMFDTSVEELEDIYQQMRKDLRVHARWMKEVVIP